ncbi:response regulator [Spirosoma utsteinense]|uniref:Response regulator of citrate/malate metabolism n=1 Tax=Spirosoma utsteinense TaxID=2585773 RepID=A0ABR6WGN6_9BACT|nr:response regulator [Spirosoma utsteinense]MBC3789441.1 response regulator of citrate/malate metabolism [Spirosoma utsteinense]MBC3795356.1 response regulator of citrate/malate metabolism [Spirosoma utsteinense]
MENQETSQQTNQELALGYCLIIEDNIIDQAKIRLIMSDLGYSTIITVDSLKSSAYFLKKMAPGVIIISFHLKDGTNGVDILNFPGIYQSKLIFVTDNPNEGLYESVQGKPNVGFLTKPLCLFVTKSTLDLLDLMVVT